ncbi:MAG: 2-C-methyl-D-erythritol 2,4-cyclodiphosphate synthase [Actinomycetia bacterium]|nr:2-C-methyl-D-erythritol 2,4-cyclodiphosphate synthase [Actinomycetes bacterium]
MRIGLGFDVHKFLKERKLILGGVLIRVNNGLEGHSDADVVVHSIIDALLGAASLGDIGEHFPDENLEYKGISSLDLLGKVNEIIKKENYIIKNIDVVVICEEPRISDYKSKMRAKISETLGIEEKDISIKGKTTEGLGFMGRNEGIAAQAVALLDKGDIDG